MARRDSIESIERELERLRVKEKGVEDRKVLDQVFDRETLLAIYKMMTDGIIETVEFPISTGKEGNVFLCKKVDGGYVALKIYRIVTATFRRISKYIQGDPRFEGLSGNYRKIIYAWASKEFRNLQRFSEAGVRVPRPIKFHKNLLAMEYIGTEQAPAPLMKDVTLENPEEIYNLIIDYMMLAFQKAELVHGDLSEYNVLVHEGKPVIIDCGQAMVTDHPNALDYLKRDITNINEYFKSLCVKVIDNDEVLNIVTGVKK
ncbi:MAG: serine protein kinase RIO [Methanomassiliicoccales archaeon]|jgi:RIO kinase 1|nr:serine protein kinase RIO [Methanomassiliicoccales archaeon]